MHIFHPPCFIDRDYELMTISQLVAHVSMNDFFSAD